MSEGHGPRARGTGTHGQRVCTLWSEWLTNPYNSLIEALTIDYLSDHPLPTSIGGGVKLFTSQFTHEIPVTAEHSFEVVGVHFLERLILRLWFFHRFPPQSSADFGCEILRQHLR